MVLLSLIATPSLTAQASDGSPQVALKIDLVSWGDDITGLSLKPGQSKTVTALGFRYSTPVEYSGSVLMEVHRSSTGESPKTAAPSADDLAHELHPLLAPDSNPAAGDAAKPKTGLMLELQKRREKDPSLVALAPLPASGCRRATVLLVPSEGSTFIAYVIDDDPSKLPLGQLRVHNLSSLTIAMRCDGKLNRELKPRESFIAPVQNQQMIYELAYKVGEEWMTQESNIIPVRGSEQTQMIILRSDNKFFTSTDGSKAGFLQIVTLRRSKDEPPSTGR